MTTLQVMPQSLKEFIDRIVNEELKTRPNNLTFKVTEDSEGDENRGWRVDKLEALIDGVAVGYLKMSWIPKERFEREYPNLLQYLAKINGKSKFLPQYSPYDMNTQTGRIKAMLDDADWKERDSKNPRLDTMTPAEARTLEKRLLTRYASKYKEFLKFKSHWVDKPLVDYIRVKNEFQRQGIAIAMYEEGAKHLATMGLRLYASSNQQPGAKAAWEWLKLHASGNIGIDNGRMFLSFL